MRNIIKTFLVMLLVLLVNITQAHDAQGGGLVNGLMHPVFGPDHLLAMVAIGILSVQIGGESIIRVPATFLIFMLLGGVLGIMKISLPAVEIGIATSVVILGLVIVLCGKNVPVFLIMAFVGFFGVFHGYAHGLEMPEVVEPLFYTAGFIISTAGLHLLGVVVALSMRFIPYGSTILRVMGVWISAVGLYMLFAL